MFEFILTFHINSMRRIEWIIRNSLIANASLSFYQLLLAYNVGIIFSLFSFKRVKLKRVSSCREIGRLRLREAVVLLRI